MVRKATLDKNWREYARDDGNERLTWLIERLRKELEQTDAADLLGDEGGLGLSNNAILDECDKRGLVINEDLADIVLAAARVAFELVLIGPTHEILELRRAFERIKAFNTKTATMITRDLLT